MKHTQPEPVPRPADGAAALQGLELRHLRYFVAVADAGTFTHAAERLFIAQPTLSQQIRRLEQVLGTPLLHRDRGGVHLSAAGTMLLDAARDVLSLVDHGVSQTRQAAGLGRARLRFAIPSCLPEALVVTTASALRPAAAVADVDVDWMDTPLDAEFSPVCQRQADAGLGWLTASPDALPALLDAMTLGEFEPDMWIPASHPAARRGSIGLDELASMDVIHGPRRTEPGTYDAWTSIVRAMNPRFEFTDPPLRHSLPVTLAFAATAGRPAAVLTGPASLAGPPPGVIRLPPPARTGDMARVRIAGHPLTATAALVWHSDLPRPLQQILFDTADAVTPPPPASLSPYDPGVSAVRADALFVSPLQRSDEPSARQVRQAIAAAIAAYGVRGCAARVAQDYGEHPETALTRMRWALTAAASASDGSHAELSHAPAPGHCTVLCTSRAARSTA